MKLAATLVSSLNVEEVLKAAESGDPRIKQFAEMLDKLSGLDLEKETPPMSALSEQPFLPPDIWALFSAYQGVMVHSVMLLKTLATGAVKFFKKEDALKPVMLLALPEYKDYIEKFGSSGYYYLLDVLEQKLLNAITEMLDGKALDEVTLKRSAEIISAVQELNTQVKADIPDDLKGPEDPEPPRM